MDFSAIETAIAPYMIAVSAAMVLVHAALAIAVLTKRGSRWLLGMIGR